MQHNLPNIFTDIKNHEIPPPQATFELLKQQLFNTEEDTYWSTFFKRFENLETEPPADMFLKISSKINGEEYPVKKKGVLTFFYKYAAVAAVLIVVVGAWMGLLQISSNKDVLQPLAQQALPAPPTEHKADSLLPGSIKKPVIIDHDMVNYNNPKIINPAIGKQDNYFAVSKAGINGYNFAVIDNDLLFTFASFKDKKMPSFFTDDDEDILIEMAPYANISISTKMKKIIADIFKTNGKGKPTKKAKKAKAKLDKWRKMDIVRFDDNLINNPLDPVDLGDFIFKN